MPIALPFELKRKSVGLPCMTVIDFDRHVPWCGNLRFMLLQQAKRGAHDLAGGAILAGCNPFAHELCEFGREGDVHG